jgi:hypothetical protein
MLGRCAFDTEQPREWATARSLAFKPRPDIICTKR